MYHIGLDMNEDVFKSIKIQFNIYIYIYNIFSGTIQYNTNNICSASIRDVISVFSRGGQNFDGVPRAGKI